MKYIVFDIKTGDRVRPNPMSLAKAQALVNFLNTSEGGEYYGYREVGIFDPEYASLDMWIVWFLIAAFIGGIIWVLSGGLVQ